VTSGIEWVGGFEWAVRAGLGMGVLWAASRLQASRAGRPWLTAVTLLAGVLSLPWSWSWGGNSLVWEWPSRIGNGADAGGWALAVWAMGAGWVLLRRGLGLVRILAWCRVESRGPAVDAWRQSWGRVTETAGVECGLKIRVVEGLPSPAIWMGRGPWLLLPTDAMDWPEATRGRVCRHELAHVLGGDAWLHRGWLLIDVVQWWNPLWWGLRGRLGLELEKRADDSAIGGDLGEARVYCRELMERVSAGVTGVPAWGGSGGLEERVGHLLARRRLEDSWVLGGTWWVAVASVVLLAFLMRGPTPAGSSPGMATEAELRLSAVAFPG